MAIGEYVDIDLYDRGFDGIYEYGAEKENEHQALNAFLARQRFQEEVKPGEYIDLDFNGRGDPRILEPVAHIQTEEEVQKHLKEGQWHKRQGYVNAHAVVFSSRLKAFARKASALVTRIFSRRTPKPSKNGGPIPVDDNDVPNEVVIQHDAGLIPADEDGEIVEVFSNTEASATLDNCHEHEQIAEVVSDRADNPPSTQETSGEQEHIAHTPNRVKSRLPSEEPRPYVEKGHVARVINSYSSLERGDSQEKIVPQKSRPLSENRLAPYSVLPLHGTSSLEVAESGTSKEADTCGTSSEEFAMGEVQEKGRPEPISIAETARGVFVESDEESKLILLHTPIVLQIEGSVTFRPAPRRTWWPRIHKRIQS